jgi:hypothetical protein
MKRLLLLLLTLLMKAGHSHAHVGSAGVLMHGEAGPYRILVNIEPPDVIPGTARITIFIQEGEVTKVTARPISFRAGADGAPSADEITVVSGQADQFKGEVWLMEPGSSSVQLHLEGNNGVGDVVIPIMAVSTAQRDMPLQLGILLGGLGLLLVFLLITTIGASVSDGILPPGQHLSAFQKRKRFINMGIATAACAVLLLGGSSWWNSWAESYKGNLYKPLQGNTSITSKNGQRILELKIDASNWEPNRRGALLNTLLPDHGKLMHLFLVRTPGLDAFAHIHPERKDSVTFESHLPQLPAGKYLMYADIVQYSGFTETIVDTVEIPEPLTAGAPLVVTAEEDTYVVTDAIGKPGKIPLDANVVICGSPGTKTKFKDGSYAVWEGNSGKPLEAGVPYQLNFELFNPNDVPLLPELYLGMTGHAAIIKSDGSVYIHLHPTGTYAMAAEKTLRNRITDTTTLARRPSPIAFRDSVDQYLANLKSMSPAEREFALMSEMMTKTGAAMHEGMDHSNRISFPYSFPSAGHYRIFLQIKRNGQVLTGIFDAQVTDVLGL